MEVNLLVYLRKIKRMLYKKEAIWYLKEILLFKIKKELNMVMSYFNFKIKKIKNL